MALQNSSIEEMHNFLNKKYYIPNYQREYSWEIEELTDFWNDLVETVKEKNDIHFFGQVVVHDDLVQNKKYIIDGQQRTTTSMIFLRALQVFYEIIYNETNEKKADYKRADIESIYLGREDEYHLTLGESDNDYYVNHILLKIDVDKKVKKKSNENIRNAFNYFYQRIKADLELKKDSDEKLERMDELFNAFIHRFKVLYMEATKLEEAFVIFETLNARGRELEIADLLKNYILSQSKDVDLSIDKWNSMIKKLDKVDPTKYIRHYWNATHNFSREKALYKTISRDVNSPKACKELLTNLDEYASVYHDLVLPQETQFFINSNIPEIRESLISLKTLKATTFYPIVLAIVQTFTNDYEKVLKPVLAKIESYVFRNLTICGNNANTTEIFFAEIAKNIFEENLSGTNEICDAITKGIVSDQEFRDSLVIWVASKSAKDTIRYIFRKIHSYLDKNLEVNLNNSEVHIEHIMPENANQWDIASDTHDTYLWRLGNLTLLSGAINISISNKPFAEKKDMLNQ